MTRLTGVSPDRVQPGHIVTVVISLDHAFGPVSTHHAAGTQSRQCRGYAINDRSLNLLHIMVWELTHKNRDDVVADLWIEVRSSSWARVAG